MAKRVPAHVCRENAAYIGGHYPWECLTCGKRLDAEDMRPAVPEPEPTPVKPGDCVHCEGTGITSGNQCGWCHGAGRRPGRR